MRRFSQRNSLVTLNEINVTPLLDLAFVLLIIFIITTPALEPGLNLKLPVGGDARTRPDTANEVTVNGLADGRFTVASAGNRMLSEKELEAELVRAYQRNPRVVLVLRVEAAAPAQVLVTLLDVCGRNGLTRFRIGTQLPKRR
jgi:biopolymer transport protein ExbD